MASDARRTPASPTGQMFSRKHSPRAFQVSELELSQIWVLTDTDVAALAPQVVRDPGRAGHPIHGDYQLV